MKSSAPPVVVVHMFNTSVQRIWNAITVLKEMRQWYFDQIEGFKPEIGFRTQFVVRVDDRTFTHLWQVTQVVPQKRITYNWNILEYPGSSDVTFELIPEGDQVLLRLVDGVFEDYPDDIPEFKRESCEKDWEYFIGQNLKAYIQS